MDYSRYIGMYGIETAIRMVQTEIGFNQIF